MRNVEVISHAQSDHLPISMEIELPEGLTLKRMNYEPLDSEKLVNIEA